MVARVVVLLVWDVLTITFFACWCIGLVAELQRSEVLSLEKLLHLPISIKGAFLINYFSSLVNLTLLIFLPGMVGLALGLAFGQGLEMLVLFLALPAFVLMVTALTYQFQGWLASLMVNKRRRRTIIALVTISFVVLMQVPNLLNIIRPWDSSARVEKKDSQQQANDPLAKEKEELKQLRAKGEITRAEYRARLEKLSGNRKAPDHEWEREVLPQVERVALWSNMAIPLGWLPLGAWAAMEDNLLIGLLGAIGMTSIGLWSLSRSYNTTLRLYTGQYTSGKGKASIPRTSAAPLPAVFLERQLPWFAEQTSAIALSGFQSLMRPEAKMMLLTPVIMVLIFGGMFMSNQLEVKLSFRPLMAFGGMGMMMLSMMQIMANQFGFDRSGFRVFVLCATTRRDILLGKNLAFAPIALLLACAAASLVQIFQPMRLDDFLACFPQAISMYLVFCLVANLLSIIVPMPIASGSLKPSNPRLVPLLLQLACGMMLPLAQLPLLIPFAIQIIAEWLGMKDRLPIYLILSLLECIMVIFVYRLVLSWQGSFLEMREQRILQIVAAKAE